MGKENLIAKGLWDAYSEKVRARMNQPSHFGQFTEADAKQEGLTLVDVLHGSETCGDAIELFLLVDPKTDTIKKARFKSFGCGTAIAAADMMTELCVGKTIDQALKLTNLEVERAMRDDPDIPAVPGQKMHCSVMAYDVIKKAVANYKNVDISEFAEKEIICHCGRITRKQIEEAIVMKKLTTVEQVMEETKAGTWCGSCIRPGGHEEKNVYLVDILEEMLKRKQAKDKEIVRPDCVPFSKLTVPLKLKSVESALDQFVRPSLAADGGGVDVMDIQGNTIFISYSGHCAGCAGALQGTLSFIRSTLKEKVDPSIQVEPFKAG
ncbi:MAG: iron-sulfur cluster assembly scaffold protein NifU [Elusimicrobia bacterium RIFOXYB2_FULL_49_7]|nr:MAG: iron-sulfur cluster assembly scaffold protein NifU [Elusimicrobia bacterium RIFOXYB2_FULL_49_7]